MRKSFSRRSVGFVCRRAGFLEELLPRKLCTKTIRVLRDSELYLSWVDEDGTGSGSDWVVLAIKKNHFMAY